MVEYFHCFLLFRVQIMTSVARKQENRRKAVIPKVARTFYDNNNAIIIILIDLLELGSGGL